MIFPKSIRWRIQLWHGALLVLLVTLLIAGFYTYEARMRRQAVDTRLQEFLTPLLPLVTPPGGLRPGGTGGLARPGESPRAAEALRAQRRAEIETNIRPWLGAGYYYAAWHPEGSVIGKSENAPDNLAAPAVGAMAGYRTRGDLREYLRISPGGELVVVGVSTAALAADLRRLAGWLAGAGMLVAGLGLAGGWWLANGALRPIAQISTTAETIAGGKLSERIDVGETESELGALARTLNTTFDRLEQNFEQQVRFTADASHELRTPIAVLLAETQRALTRERPPEEYREALAVCERNATRMSALVNSLLELARFDSGEVALHTEVCDLARLARESLEFIAPLAAQKNVVLRDAFAPVTTRADALKLGQVLNNLLTNAIVHNRAGTTVTLSLARENGHAVLRVADDGVGIPGEALPRLFERFYRVDAARGRERGGSGLGLSITKAIVEAHGGSIAVESEAGKGTTFTVRIPIVE
jgi:two-component system, OmpR family, sensor kinase